jgi:hypothetical protein
MEEILYRVHELGLFEEFIEEVKKLRINNKYKSAIEIYETALENVLKNFEQKT